MAGGGGGSLLLLPSRVSRRIDLVIAPPIRGRGGRKHRDATTEEEGPLGEKPGSSFLPHFVGETVLVCCSHTAGGCFTYWAGAQQLAALPGLYSVTLMAI